MYGTGNPRLSDISFISRRVSGCGTGRDLRSEDAGNAVNAVNAENGLRRGTGSFLPVPRRRPFVMSPDRTGPD
ncbi:hypothetical protein GCM10010293_41680 [Streptomyces griseoflavus]|nr:hypothetical protein GCM10010293_41680 [Streptomyces griseoflavus]